MDANESGLKVAITGGSSGVGLETARLFLSEGAQVAICGRDRERLSGARDDLGANEDRLITLQCDVLEKNEVEEFALALKDVFGGLDILINNAGRGRISTFASTNDEAWREEIELKLFSIIYPTRAFLPLLEKSGHASIVISNALLARQPEPHMVATSSARAAVLNLNSSMAAEFAPKGIRVNSILMGLVESEQWRRRFEEQAKGGQTWEDWTRELAKTKSIPLGRLGKPHEAAKAIFFLASPLSSYITGTTLDISGGLARHA